MSTIVFDGKTTARKEEAALRRLIKRKTRLPKLVSILSDSNKESLLYTSLKAKAAARLGLPFQAISLPFRLRNLNYLSSLLARLNGDSSVGGILVQLPFFDRLDDLAARSLIAVSKDVDCLTPFNLGLIQLGRPVIFPATVKAVLDILAQTSNHRVIHRSPGAFANYRRSLHFLKGKHVTIVGSQGMVGSPLVTTLSYLGATVIACDRHSENLAALTSQADILISSAGVPKLIRKGMVRKGSILIDVGTSIVDDRVVGDIDPLAAPVSSFFTPVPGGVGPLTVVSLMRNFLSLALTNNR